MWGSDIYIFTKAQGQTFNLDNYRVFGAQPLTSLTRAAPTWETDNGRGRRRLIPSSHNIVPEVKARILISAWRPYRYESDIFVHDRNNFKAEATRRMRRIQKGNKDELRAYGARHCYIAFMSPPVGSRRQSRQTDPGLVT